MPDATVRRIILGTAGHIDHGKTRLVERLTGTNADRLPEEQARGMTIDVGYATFVLEDGTEVGLLDVPGHERLVRTMVAGATAMDLALLVVAADDGPMPQTREHVEILDVLGITRLVVALTKTDLVDEEMQALAAAEVEDLLSGTGMAGAPILPVSSETGEGIDALRTAIQETMAPVDPDLEGPAEHVRVFRMPVLRSFLVKGRGAVVTGIPLSGRVADGERVEVLPRAWGSRVRGIQVHHRDSEQARAGHRAALALTDIHVDKIKRGMVVATAGALRPTHRVATQLRLLPHVKKPVAHGDRARLHLGADQIVVRIHLPAGTPVQPGQTAVAELESDTEFTGVPGDRFVLRMENAMGTLGGGVVIQGLDRRLPRRKPKVLEALLARVPHLRDPLHLVRFALDSARDEGLALPEIGASTGLRVSLLPDLMTRLADEGHAVAVGRAGHWIAAPTFHRIRDRVVETVQKLHAKDKAQDSLTLAAVRAAMGRVSPTVLDAAIDEVIDGGEIVRTATGNVRHKRHSVDLPPEEKARCDKIQKTLAAGQGQPPSMEELVSMLGMPKPVLSRSLRLMASRGRAFRAEDYWFDGVWLEERKEALRALAEKQGGFTPADARQIMNTTRKWVIPLLEALDKSGFSRRAGNKRVLKT